MLIICTKAGELEIIVLSEINQSQTNATYFLSDAESVFKEQNKRTGEGAKRKQIRGNRETKGDRRTNR